MQLINFLKNRILGLVREEEAQDGVEYLLVIGGVSVLLIASLIVFTTGMDGLVQAVCTSITDTTGLEFTCAA